MWVRRSKHDRRKDELAHEAGVVSILAVMLEIARADCKGHLQRFVAVYVGACCFGGEAREF